jgi:hypothetical protein
MINEVNIFFENLTHFRQLLSEGVGQGTIVDAINKHKIAHIYYAGDDTILKGYRTIKPYVLGHTANKDAIKKGKDYLLLRAWETAGNSDSRKIYYNQKGKGEYGWRLFRVDKITSFLPTGELFSTEKSKFPDPEHYNPDDSQMRSIIAKVEITGDQPKTSVKGNVTQQQVQPSSGDTSVFAGQKEKFQRFSNVAKKQRAVTADEIKHLWGMVSQMRARGAKAKYWVVQNEHGDMILKSENQLANIDPDAVVGNLRDLYNKLVLEPKPVDNSFLKQVDSKMAKDNIAKENLNKKDFFKNQ